MDEADPEEYFMEPIVSFIIPAYNAGKFLEKCLGSILRLPKYRYDVEVVVIDDGSTDNTSSVCSAFAEKDNRVKFDTQVNGGTSSARNRGIELAKGKYVIFVDADDEFLEKNFENLYRILEEECYDIIGFNYETVNSDGTKFSESFVLNAEILTPQKLGEKFISYPMLGTLDGHKDYMGAKVFQYAIRKSLLLENKIYFPVEIHFAEDTCFLFKVMQHASTLKFLPIILYRYYIFEESVSHSYKKDYSIEILKMSDYILENAVYSIDENSFKIGIYNMILRYYVRFLNYRDYKVQARRLFELADDVLFRFEEYKAEYKTGNKLYCWAIIYKSVLLIYINNKYWTRIVRKFNKMLGK